VREEPADVDGAADDETERFRQVGRGRRVGGGDRQLAVVERFESQRERLAAAAREVVNAAAVAKDLGYDYTPADALLN